MEDSITNKIRSEIIGGNIEKLKIIIENNPKELYEITPFGSWLHVAATSGKIDIVKYLVEKKLDINLNGGTFDGSAINLAALHGHIDIVVYLYERGALLDVSLAKRNPLFSAIQGGHEDIVCYLIIKGIDTAIKYKTDYMVDTGAYEFALKIGNDKIISCLEELL